MNEHEKNREKREGRRQMREEKERKEALDWRREYIYIYTYDKKIWSEKGERLKDKRLRMAANGIQRKRIAFFS